MKTLIVVNSSARINRSITRQLVQRAQDGWLKGNPGGRVRHLDVGQHPPPPIDERWIAAAYTRQPDRTEEMRRVLAASDGYIDLLLEADAYVFGAPIYNFGLPAQLKAFFEQIIRIGRTFDFAATPEKPYIGLLPDRPVLIVSAAGSTSLVPGGNEYKINFLDPHLATVLDLIGLQQLTFARVSGQQSGLAHLRESISRAELEIDAWIATQVSKTVNAAA